MEIMECFLEQNDIADLAIETLRKFKRWDYTGRILSLYEKQTKPMLLMRRSVLRFAVQSPTPQAAAFVAKMRKEDAEWVAEQTEILQFEVEQNTVPK